MKLEVAALLPCGGLTAYTAIMRARPYIRECEDRKGMTGMYMNVLAGNYCTQIVVIIYFDSEAL